jgi:hypothetical protein
MEVLSGCDCTFEMAGELQKYLTTKTVLYPKITSTNYYKLISAYEYTYMK